MIYMKIHFSSSFISKVITRGFVLNTLIKKTKKYGMDCHKNLEKSLTFSTDKKKAKMRVYQTNKNA